MWSPSNVQTCISLGLLANRVKESVTRDLPVVGARGKPYVSHQCEATDRIGVLDERPCDLVFLPEFDCFVRGTFDAAISGARMDGN